MQKECVLYKKQKTPLNSVRCFACSHKCLISDGKTGICGIRKNIQGKLFLLVYGLPVSLNVDPIEKKPLYHFMPKTKTYSFGTVGCNFRCLWCQNYEISQQRNIYGIEMSPKGIVENAIKSGCKSISYTYNEPAIFIEFVKDVAVIAKQKGLKNILVTNGYFTKESFEFIKNEIDAMNIDLKTFDEKKHLKFCGAKLKPVLETIKRAVKSGIHVEITTLVVPKINDSEKELEKIAKFIFSLDKKGNIPWHISRFFPMYKMKDSEPTSLKILKKAETVGKKYLKYVYVGNV
jgi:pyruvate formate lyase activating enzyme